MAILGIMLGGALGSLARYALSVWLQGAVSSTSLASFPLGTLAVNVVGSFLLSVVTTLGLQGVMPPTMRLSLSVGFLGALTTFSTFQQESEVLLAEGHGLFAALYVVGNLSLGYLAILLGRDLVIRWGGGA
jgi:CrcB protein